MKTQWNSATKRGFTLMELMVAMTITTFIVTVLVSITSIALDTWNRSRAELRASRQAKSMIDTIAHDFESLVTRRGNSNEWLSAIVDPQLSELGDRIKSENASRLIFFTAATDRYNGNIGKQDVDKGGDVSCVGYQLEYRDPIDRNGETKTFVLNRLLVNPDETFTKLLGATDATKSLESVFTNFYGTKLSDGSNFVCENVFQFSVTFHVQVTDATKTPPVFTVPVTIGSSRNSSKFAESFVVQGTGIKSDSKAVAPAIMASGRITAVEISVTVVSDFGIDQLRTRKFDDDKVRAEFLGKNSYEYSKLVQLPSM
jgi:prepilin-type N-terminal cleavage/methylation domain-containing protein